MVRRRVSVRATAFWNVLDDAISNVTLSRTPPLITLQRQNADKVRSAGVEVEADVQDPAVAPARLHQRHRQCPLQGRDAGSRQPGATGARIQRSDSISATCAAAVTPKNILKTQKKNKKIKKKFIQLELGHRVNTLSARPVVV